MGVVLTRYCETEFKRARLHFNTYFGLEDSASSNNSNLVSPLEYSVWENLPCVALVEIYRFLPGKDRFNLSLTCRAWSRAFSRPEVWRHAKFDFNGVNDWRALRFPASLASGLSHLVIDSQYASNTNQHQNIKSMDNLNTFLNNLVTFKTCRLITLKIINTGYLSRNLWFLKRNFLFLRELISIQTRLKLLDLTRADLRTEDGVCLMLRIASRCGSTITSLAIDGMYEGIASPCTDNLWQSFTQLTDLTLSYQYLSDEFLNALTVSGSLMRLAVLASVFNIDTPQTSTGAWEQLTRSRPSLETRFCFNQDVACSNYMCRRLVPGIPLVTLEFNWLDLRGNWSYLSKHIATHFQNSLRHLVIVIEHNLFWADQLLDAIIESCLLLEEISFTDLRDHPSLQASIVRLVRLALDRQPASRLRRFTFNGEEVELKIEGMTEMSRVACIQH